MTKNTFQFHDTTTGKAVALALEMLGHTLGDYREIFFPIVGGKSVLVKQIQKCSQCLYVLLLFKKPINPFEQSTYKLLSGFSHKHRIVEVGRQLWGSSGPPLLLKQGHQEPIATSLLATILTILTLSISTSTTNHSQSKIVSLAVLHCLASDQKY